MKSDEERAKDIWNRLCGYKQAGKEKPYLLILSALREVRAEEREAKDTERELMEEVVTKVKELCDSGWQPLSEQGRTLFEALTALERYRKAND